MEFDLKLITELLQALLLAVLPVLGVTVVGYVVTAIKSYLSIEQHKRLRDVILTGVFAAEQIWKDELKAGYEKKDWVINFVENYLESKGLPIDVGLIEAEIEAAVLTNFPDIEQYIPDLEG